MSTKLLSLMLALILIGCGAVKEINPQHPGTPDALANLAYNTVVGAKGFLDSIRSAHPECQEVGSSDPSIIIPAGRITSNSDLHSTRCHLLMQATAAKDLLIDAGEEYCSGGQFEFNGACNPPTKGAPKFQILTDKLRASINAYTAIERDLKGVQ